MNEAIKLAIEKGGWKILDSVTSIDYKNASWPMIHGTHNNVPKLYPVAEVIISPSFWQALGKALGWEDKEYKLGEEVQIADGNWFKFGRVTMIEGNKVKVHLAKSGYVYLNQKEWLYHAHEYFDLLLTNGDTVKFWKGLLEANTAN
jgi:hypothetical protein